MTPSQRIRKAALGPTPNGYFADLLYGWLDQHECADVARRWCVKYFAEDGFGRLDFHSATDTERRMFLLFVAEALES